jgi:hypothetical protein
MEIRIDNAAVRSIRDAAQAAAAIHNTFGLEIDLCIIFTHKEVQSIEARLDDGDLFRFLRDVVASWDRVDPEQVMLQLARCLSHLDIQLQYDLSPDAPTRASAEQSKAPPS